MRSAALPACLVLLAISATALAAQQPEQQQPASTAQQPAASAQQPAAPHAAAPETPEHIEMQKVEDRWSDAVTRHDQYALELVLAPQLVDISAAGEVTNRNQQIVALFRKDSPIQSLEQKVITVRMLADGSVAVVNGTYIFHTKADGTRKDEKGIFTHVFTRVRTNWLCISSQRTLVVEQVLNKPRPKPQKSGDLPFKIPLIYDGHSKDGDEKKPQ